MSDIVQFVPRRAPQEIDYFGGCPHCGNAEHMNVGGDHYGVCRQHRAFWYIGYNLFSAWRDEPQSIWDSNAAILKECREVKPIYAPERSA